jgi:broad specificity phosphatase PhoE
VLLILVLVIGLGLWLVVLVALQPRDDAAIGAPRADRDRTLDALTPAGATRAQELVLVGEKAGLAAIYRSSTIRARDTAAPLASALELTLVEYVASNTGPLVDTIFANNRGQKVLVVSHSNTVSPIIEAAGGPTLFSADVC